MNTKTPLNTDCTVVIGLVLITLLDMLSRSVLAAPTNPVSKGTAARASENMVEAGLRLQQHLIAERFTRCGASHFIKYVGDPKRAIVEVRGLVISLGQLVPTDIDRANGIEWLGKWSLAYTMTRIFTNGEWSEWSKVNIPYTEFDEDDYNMPIQKKHGVWTIESTPNKHFARITCAEMQATVASHGAVQPSAEEIAKAAREADETAREAARRAAEPKIELPRVDLKRSPHTADFYPAASRRAGEEGTVYLSVLVAVNGSVKEAAVTRSAFPRLDAAALKYVRSLTFVPGTSNGVPEEMRFEFKINFSMRP